MFSHRVPDGSAPNAWSRRLAERRAAGAALLDLSEANPTAVGLGGAAAVELAALADPRGLEYRPDPQGSPSARAAVAAYLAARGPHASPETLVLTSSTSEGYAHLFRLLAEPGERILVPAPSYPLFEPLALAEGVELHPYRIAWDGRWHIDPGALERAAADPRARAVIVVQPNHPTGSCLSAEEREWLVGIAARQQLALIADEVFGDYPWGSAPLPSLVGEARVPTFVMSGLSKVCGMPQMKLAWIAVSGPEPARERALQGLVWLADLFLSVSGPVQHALPQLLAARPAFQARVRERIALNRAALGATLARRPALSWLAGEGGWVAVLRLPATRTEEEWVLALLAHEVVVHPGHFYDLEGEPFIVVSLIVPPATFAAGLARLEALLPD